MTCLSVERLEDRVTPVTITADVDVAEGFLEPELGRLTSVAAGFASNTRAWSNTLPATDGGHSPNPVTIVLDFKEPAQPNTADIFGNVVSSFDVKAYGFSLAQYSAVVASIAAEVDQDYFAELDGTVAGPPGKDLANDFVVGDIGTPPATGATKYYYIQIGSGVSGPHATSGGTLGVAGLQTVRTSTGGIGIAPVGSVVGSMFTDHINALSGVGDALTSGNLEATTFAVSGTLSHEAGHTLSLSHINKAGSVQPTSGAAPLMGTGAIDLPNADRLTDREFSLSGFDGENGNAPRQHIQQLATAVGLHSVSAVAVTNVASPVANGVYVTGDVIPITVQFSQPVTVIGTPTLALNSGGTAVYVSGSGTDTLALSYTVGSGQTATDLSYTTTSALQGDIRDSNGILVGLTLPAPGAAGSLGANKNITVNPFPTVPVLGTVAVNDTGNAPSATTAYSRLTALVLTFNTPVTADPGAFRLTSGVRVLTNTPGGGILVSGGGTTQLTLTFASGVSGVEFGSLADGSWNLTVDMTRVRSVFDLTGSGMVTRQNIRRLYGDGNGDGVVTQSDLNAYAAAFGLSDTDDGFLSLFDHNGDGQVNLDDLGEFASRFGTGL